MKHFHIKLVISEQDQPERQLTASLDNVREDQLLSSLTDLPLQLLLKSFKEASGHQWYEPPIKGGTVMAKERKLGHAQQYVLEWFQKNPGPHTFQEAFEGHRVMGAQAESLTRRGLLRKLPDGRYEAIEGGGDGSATTNL